MEPWIWAIIIVVFLVVEFSATELVSIWLAAGSLAGLVLSLIPGVGIWWQILSSILISLVLIIFTRPIVKKWLSSKNVKTNVDEIIIDKVVELLEPVVDSVKTGVIKVNGVRWSVISDKPIEAGKSVRILKLDGNKLIVEEDKRENK